MIPTYDAWALRRLLVGDDLNGELHAVSEAFRPMADCLAAVPVDDALTGQARREVLAAARAPLWESVLADRPDGDELVMTLAEVNPEGPAPEPEPNNAGAGRRFKLIRAADVTC